VEDSRRMRGPSRVQARARQRCAHQRGEEHADRLRHSGAALARLYERYVEALAPAARDRVVSLIPGVWLPIELGSSTTAPPIA